MSADVYREFIRRENLKSMYLDDGIDSIVYQLNHGDEEYVVKVYRKALQFPDELLTMGLDIDKAVSYMQITNEAVEYMRQSNFIAGGLPVVVNPILDTIFDEKQACCVNISKFISGPRIYDFLLEYGIRRFTHDSSLNVSTTSQSEHLRPDNWKVQLGFDIITQKLNKVLGVTGIYLSETNIKLTEQGFVITDLCSEIERLQFVSRNEMRCN